MNTLGHTTHPMLPVAGRRAAVRAVAMVTAAVGPQLDACPRSAMRAHAGTTGARTAKQAAIWSHAVSHPGPGGSA